MKKAQILLLLWILVLSSCQAIQGISVREEFAEMPSGESFPIEPNHPAELELQAQETLTEYFQSLSQGLYDRAVELYGGTYDELAYLNPAVDPDERAQLLKAGCEFNGFMCLPILSNVLVLVENQQDFYFDVEFSNPDGSLFVLGPCCGATEEIMPPMSVFTIQVRCGDAGLCQVLDLPPYVP